MALQAGSDSIHIHSFLVAILGEAPGSSGDVLERMDAAFPGRQETVRQVISEFLASERHEVSYLQNKIYASALQPLLDTAEASPASMKVLACGDAVMRYVKDYCEQHLLNHKVEKERLLHQVSFMVRDRSPDFLAAYNQAKNENKVPKIVVNPSHVTNANEVGFQLLGGARGGSFSVTGGTTANPSAGSSVEGGGSEAKQAAAAQEEVLQLLRGLTVEVREVNMSQKRQRDETDALNKRLRSVEEENGVRGAQMVHVQRDLDQHNNQILTLQGQVNGFTSLLGGMLGGGGIQGALVGGGGAGPVGGIVGYNGGGGMFRGAQTSVLHRPIPSTHTTTTTTPTATSAARRGAGSRSATLPTAGRSTRSKSKQGSTRAADSSVVDVTSDSEEESGPRKKGAGEDKEAGGGGASESKGAH